MLFLMDYKYIADLAGDMTIPQNGILSRTLHNDERLKAVLFGFDAGQELSEHTAAVPAVLHILQGEARLRLGGDHMEAKAGAWVHMPPQLPHAVYAKTPVVMLLLMLKSPA
jgi:quercetin dioxygenase-like cupin family protein